MTEMAPETFPAVTRFQCGHGTVASLDNTGLEDGVWLVLTLFDGTVARASMPPEDAMKVALSLMDSVKRATS